MIYKMKHRIQKALEEKRKIKLIFEYPNTKAAKIRRGFVKRVNEDSFDFQEDRDGRVTYRYKYLVEIKNEY